MKLKRGKWYKDRNGQVWKIVYIHTNTEVRYPVIAINLDMEEEGIMDAETFSLSGEFMLGGDLGFNLVEEVTCS